jgi:cyclohexa-1,5-dienecarbonyl-CoA hydratase
MLHKIETAFLFDHQIFSLTLNSPKGNVLDREMIFELTDAVKTIGADSKIKAIVFTGAGGNFSFGASIPEHRQEIVADLLSKFHDFFRTLVQISKPMFAVVRGKCLGGGLELAAFCNWIFASEDAQFGQPEIKLGVFPPVASLILPHRIGQSAADDLILSGRTISAHEAQQLGLVHSVSGDPQIALNEFLEAYILPKSAVALEYAMRSSRFEMHRAFLENIDRVERLYLEELMRTNDANEGILAFMKKRPPKWKNS